MKDRHRCRSCRYSLSGFSNSTMKSCCNYLEITGESRIMKEKEDGSYGSKHCNYYEPQKRRSYYG